MSYAAIYDVTRTLRMLLHSQIIVASPGAVVTLLPPGDSLPDVSGVNLYLYRVIEEPSTRNRPWRGDRATPTSNEPALGLQLFYLLTPLGTRPEDGSYTLGDDAHTMLGLAMLTLHEHPIVNDVHMPGFDADIVLPVYMLRSYEHVKITLLPTSIEDLSKIWATINKPYRLSVAYQVSLVELSPTAPPPVGGGRVLSTGVEVITLDPPRLMSLVPATGALARMVGATVTPNDLAIAGYGFTFPGQTPTVRVGGQPAAIKSAPAPTDQSLTVPLPVNLDAGPQADVRISLDRRTSTPLTFTVSPWLASAQPIRTSLDAAHVPDEMTLSIQGEGFILPPQTVRFDSPAVSQSSPANAGGTANQATVPIPVSLPNGVYQVRVVLSDPGSSVSNARTLEVIPLVDSPIGLAVIAVGGSNVHQITVHGARLDGGDVRLVIDGVTYQTGANATAATLVYALGRLLDTGAHTVTVNVDGHRSRAVDMEV